MMLNNRIILVGEGLVGRAAFTGHHQWILANSFNRNIHPPEVINEMLLQFSAGIQTVAVVPVIPHGVVQFGSSLPIMENSGFVNEVKGLILQLECVPGDLLSENYGARESADVIGVPVSQIIHSQAHKIVNPVDLVTEPNLQRDIQVEGWGNLGGAPEEWRKSAKVVSANPDVWLNETFSSTFNSERYSGFPKNDTDTGNECSVTETCSDICSKFSAGSDLFDILGLDRSNKACEDGWSFPIDTKTEFLTREMSDVMNIQEMGSGIYSGHEVSRTDHLLDAVISGTCSFSKQIGDDDTSESCRTTLTKVSNSSVNTASNNCFQPGVFEIPKAEKKQGPSTCLLTEFDKGHNLGGCSQTAFIYGSQISSWLGQAHSLKHEGSVSTGCSRTCMNGTVKPASRKRVKTGENPRPRPKDRQMIQDRVKELREIIPNGAKCSIDALLERTIKHMLFLQNVAKHADKLKQSGESKIMEEGGATWAFEVGSQPLVCPITVEDLSTPRCFKVEMLCEQRGFFLEIADWIRSLGLTILKGFMETRKDKIWARFVVDANRDVTRMEIFMQLVNIFEQTVKCIGPTSNMLDGVNATMPMNYCHPHTATTGPVNGGC
ncbi:PREDICTED: transcription factor LHW-like isoform X2 [Tarenaya hassleriana]|nr:PREDICTED: transcription factor LHW-like isoform X2 [Tarenaya hassleriana]